MKENFNGIAGKTVADLKVGDFYESSRMITAESALSYANITGDYNPIHFKTAVAYASRYKEPIVHGMILAGFISGIIGSALPGNGCIYESQTMRFLKPVYYGDTIKTRVEIIRMDIDRNRVTANTTCRNQNDEVVLIGEAVILPRKEKRVLLSSILTQIHDPCTLKSDGTFSTLEQCTRIRSGNALTYLESTKYREYLNNDRISCLICASELESVIPNSIQGVVVTPTPKAVFFHIQNLLVQKKEKWPTQIAPSARISESAVIAPYNVIIGENVEIQPQVVIHENVSIGDNVRICSGTIVGGQSYTAVKDADGGMFLALDAGSVKIESGVEICGGCHIACGTLENDCTTIGAFTKLDAMVHIGHGTVIGKYTLIPAGAMISGNCEIGDHVWIGVNATVSNRIVIGDNARVSLGSVVTKDVPDGVTVTGNFAIPHATFLRNLKASLSDSAASSGSKLENISYGQSNCTLHSHILERLSMARCA